MTEAVAVAVKNVMNAVAVTVTGTAAAGYAGAADRASRPVWRRGWVSCGVCGVFAAAERSALVECRKCGIGLESGCENEWLRPVGRCRLLGGPRGPLGIYPGGRAGQKS